MKKILKFGIIGALFLFLVFFIVLKNISGTTKVVVLKNDVNKGKVVTEEDVGIKDVSNKDLLPDMVLDQKDVIGKSLKSDRFKDDFIPKKIIGDNEIKLKTNEMIITIFMPKEDTKLISKGNEIALALLENNSSEKPQIVKDLIVTGIEDLPKSETNDTANSNSLVILKTSDVNASKVVPYLKQNQYKPIILPQKDTTKQDITEDIQKDTTKKDTVENKK